MQQITEIFSASAPRVPPAPDPTDVHGPAGVVSRPVRWIQNKTLLNEFRSALVITKYQDALNLRNLITGLAREGLPPVPQVAPHGVSSALDGPGLDVTVWQVDKVLVTDGKLRSVLCRLASDLHVSSAFQLLAYRTIRSDAKCPYVLGSHYVLVDSSPPSAELSGVAIAAPLSEERNTEGSFSALARPLHRLTSQVCRVGCVGPSVFTFLDYEDLMDRPAHEKVRCEYEVVLASSMTML